MANPVAVVANAVHAHIQTHPDRILFPPFLVIKRIAANLELTLLRLQTYALSLQLQAKANVADALKLNDTTTRQCIHNAMKHLISAIVAWTQHVDASNAEDKQELLLVLCDLAKLCVQGFVQQSVSEVQLNLSPEDLNMLLLAFGDLSKSAIVEECVNIMESGKITFPWKKYYLEDSLDKKFKALQRYEAQISIDPFVPHNIKFECNSKGEPFLPFTFEGGSPCLLISSDADYWNMDIITDYFTEKPRMAAKRIVDKESITERWPKDRTLLTEMARAAFESDETKEHGLCTLSLRESLYKCANECTQFKASLAVSILGLLQSKRVLDISAGWGDRLLAAIALNVERYVGADPNTALKAGHDAMLTRFASDRTERFKIIYAPFEDAELGLEQFDTIFTSPPFWNFEVYSNLPGQSVNNFKEEVAWTVDFLFLSLKKAWHHLSPEGYMAIHIADVFKTKVCEAMCLFCEWKLEKCKYIGLLGSAGSVSEKVRPIWVFQKVLSADLPRMNKAGSLLSEFYPQIHKRLSSAGDKTQKRKHRD